MNILEGREVNINGKEGEITKVLHFGYEVSYFDRNLGKTYIDERDIYKYLV
mgnify:FL=1